MMERFPSSWSSEHKVRVSDDLWMQIATIAKCCGVPSWLDRERVQFLPANIRRQVDTPYLVNMIRSCGGALLPPHTPKFCEEQPARTFFLRPREAAESFPCNGTQSLGSITPCSLSSKVASTSVTHVPCASEEIASFRHDNFQWMVRFAMEVTRYLDRDGIVRTR